MAILITNGVGKGDLGMVTTFCSCNQVNMEASEALPTLHQHASPEPSVFMERRYTNIPFIPQGTSRLLYLNVSDLPRGTSSQFLWTACTYGSCFHILRPRCSYPVKRGRQGIEHTPLPKRFYANAPKSCTASPTRCHYECLCQLPLPPRRRPSEGGKMAITQPFNSNFNQARAQLESELS